MRPELSQFLKFLVAGLFNTAFGYCSYALLVVVGLPISVAVAGSTILGIFVNYVSYGRFVFAAQGWGRLPRYLLVYVGIGLGNYLLLAALEGIGVTPLWGQAALLPILALSGFAGMRYFVFDGEVVATGGEAR